MRRTVDLGVYGICKVEADSYIESITKAMDQVGLPQYGKRNQIRRGAKSYSDTPKRPGRPKKFKFINHEDY